MIFPQESSGQIKILSPAIRDRIRVDRMIDRNNRIGEVLGASIEIQKGVNVTPPEGLCPFARLETTIGQKKNPPSVYSVPLAKRVVNKNY